MMYIDIHHMNVEGCHLASEHNRFNKMLNDLRNKIKSGEWQPGERMPTLTKLSDEYNVGMSTTREVLRALESESLIEIFQGRGTFVSTEDVRSRSASDQVSITELMHLLNLSKFRSMVEPSFAETAAIQALQEEIELIVSSAERMKALAEQGLGTKEEDLHFHMLIAKATHNPYAISFYKDLQDKLREGRQYTNVPGMIEKAAHYHSMIAEAIKQRNGSQARMYMASHLEANEEHVLAKLSNGF